MIMRILKIFFILLLWTAQVSAQKVYFSTDTWGFFRGMAVMDLETNNITYLGHSDYILIDPLGMHPNGDLYGNVAGDFFRYNVNELDTTFLFYYDYNITGCTGMVFDKNGIGYGGGVVHAAKPGQFGFYKFDIEKKQVDYLGDLGHLLSDMTFRKGKMLGVTESGSIIEVNIKSPISSKLIFYYPTQPDTDLLWHMRSMFTINHSCDSMNTYVSKARDTVDINGIPFSESIVYKVNFQTKSLEFVTSVQYNLMDAATMGEFLPYECVVSIDLDRDNSTGVIDDDYDGEMKCGWQFPIADDDVRIRNDYNEPFDSVDLLAVNPLPDGVNERIIVRVVDNNFILKNIGNNTWRITPQNKVTNNQWETFISGLDYINDLQGNSTKGNRIFDTRGYYAYDTSHSISTLYVRDKADAGPEQFIDICKDGLPVELKTLLSAGTDLTGWFQPNYTYYDPQINTESSLLYVVNDDGRKCPDSTTINIVLQDSPLILIKDTVVCIFPTEITASIKGPYDKVVWDDGSNNLKTTIQEAGIYTLSAQNKGCKSTGSVEVSYKSVNTITIADSIQYCIGSSILLSPTIIGNVDSVRWNTGITEKNIEVSKEGKYTLSVYSKDCILTKEIYVIEDPCLKASVYLPNVFSPNNDGINDEFMPDLINADPLELSIFDRWGAKVFLSDGKTGWNGDYKGKIASGGVYTYFFRYNDVINKKEKLVKGDVTLIR